MSGIVGIVNLDGAPVDHALLQRMTDFQSFRGPDAKQIWLNGNIGFGHTLLKTTDESENEHQPFTLDGNVWIVADARVDAQRDLIAQLLAKGQEVQPGATDVELILRAYLAWGEDCVEHLLGDFTFGIWDGPQQRLFCARDQMGVKCFYYAHLGSCVIFSNSIDCIRQHPAVSDHLNDLAVVDVLLFESNLDQATTSFADIQRMQPAYKATWSSDGVRQSRYWTAPIEEPVFYKCADDYTDRLMELLKCAVGDRLRTPRVGIFMSGGIDSPAVAAVACGLSRERSLNIDLRAFTTIASFGPDEGFYAGLVAEQLGIPIEYRDGDEDSIHTNWERVRIRTPEPVSNPGLLPIHPTPWDQLGRHSRVALQGDGPDNAFSVEWKPYVTYLIRRRRFRRLFIDSCLFLASHKRIPFWGRISRAFRKGDSDDSQGPCFREWINKDLETRFDLRARWERYYSPPPSIHPVRPLNYALLHIPGEFQDLFRSHDAEVTQSQIEVRYPFMDLRLLHFFLIVPPIPWCSSKYLLRRAMKGKLPEAVLRRPKEGTPTHLIMERVERGRTPLLKFAPEFQSYVDTERLPISAPHDMWAAGGITSARLLNHWLQYSYRRE